MKNSPLVTGFIGFVAIFFEVSSGAYASEAKPSVEAKTCALGQPGAAFTMGVRFMRAEVVGNGVEPATRQRQGLFGNALVALEVSKGGPADRAGLVALDRIVKVNGFDVPDTLDANAQVARHLREPLRTGQPIEVEVLRRFAVTHSGASAIQMLSHTVRIAPVLVCGDGARTK